jgi:hypothetical protein
VLWNPPLSVLTNLQIADWVPSKQCSVKYSDKYPEFLPMPSGNNSDKYPECFFATQREVFTMFAPPMECPGEKPVIQIHPFNCLENSKQEFIDMMRKAGKGVEDKMCLSSL